MNKNRNEILATIYSFAVGGSGLLALVLLTEPRALVANAVPLAFFAALSLFVKRAGFHIAPQVTHSLVGIVDLAAVFIFGPILGAWVAASSGFSYLFLNAWRREQHSFHNLFEIPIFNAGLKVGMAFASGQLYEMLGGQFPPGGLTPAVAPAFVAAMLAWFTVDHLGWGLMELVRGGWKALVDFLRQILYYSLLVELLPLPLSIVIALVYSQLDLGVFVLLALGLLGMAIVVQRLADASAHLERRRNELAVLNEFGQALSQAAFDPERIVDLLCEHARRIAPADISRIELFDPKHAPEGGTFLALEATRDETRRLGEIEPTSPLIEYFSTHREPIRAANMTRSLVYPFDATGTALAVRNQIQVNGRAPNSALLAPMFAGEQLIGVMGLYAARTNAFFPIHARNLMSMASHAAVAIQNARLYAVERKRAAELAMVSEVSRQVAAVLDLDDLFQQVVHRIRERFGYYRVHIFTVDKDAGYVVFRASTDPHRAEWRENGWRLRLGLEGIVGWVAAIGEPLIVDDISKEPRFILGPHETETETRSEVAVPLIVGKEVVGVLDVEANTLKAFDQEDLFILRTLGAQVAIAIEDARLYNAQREEAWYLNVLLQVSQNLAATTDLDDALETVVRITPLLVGVARCAILLYHPAERAFLAGKAYGLSPEQQQAFHRLVLRSDDDRVLAQLRNVVPNVLENGPIIIQDPEASTLVGPELRESFDIHTLLIAPLVTRGEIVGAMLVDQEPRSRHFTQHEIDVVMGIANQAAVAIEGARLQSEAEGRKRYEYELGLARQIQESFLPEACPVIPGYDICSMWQTAREVGGDFYDFIPLSGGRWAAVIADVSDKGIAAALFMALSRTIIRTMAISKQTPHEALERSNDVILADARSEMFVTVFFGVLDPPTGRFTYGNAGHNPPLLYRANTKQVTSLKGHGLVLGVLPNVSLDEYTLDLKQGDLLLLYTDGVTEAVNAQEEEFGTDRLASIVAACGDLSATQVIDEIAKAVTEFVGDQPPFDDQTMLAIKRVEPDHPGISTVTTVSVTEDGGLGGSD